MPKGIRRSWEKLLKLLKDLQEPPPDSGRFKVISVFIATEGRGVKDGWVLFTGLAMVIFIAGAVGMHFLRKSDLNAAEARASNFESANASNVSARTTAEKAKDDAEKARLELKNDLNAVSNKMILLEIMAGLPGTTNSPLIKRFDALVDNITNLVAALDGRKAPVKVFLNGLQLMESPPGITNTRMNVVKLGAQKEMLFALRNTGRQKLSQVALVFGTAERTNLWFEPGWKRKGWLTGPGPQDGQMVVGSLAWEMDVGEISEEAWPSMPPILLKTTNYTEFFCVLRVDSIQSAKQSFYFRVVAP